MRLAILKFIGLVLFLSSCEPKRFGDPVESVWFFNYVLVDSIGTSLFEEISQLPFNTSKSYWLDEEGFNHQITVSELDSIGVVFSAYRSVEDIKLDSNTNQFEWLLYTNPELDPDTLFVKGLRLYLLNETELILINGDTAKYHGHQFPHPYKIKYP